MKKLAITLTAILACVGSAIAAPAFTPTGKIITSSQSAYTLVDDSFAGQLSYSTQFPGFIPASTQSVYAVVASQATMPPNQPPAIGDVNIVTYRAEMGPNACTFQYTYLGNQKFQIVSLTSNSGCGVQNGTDLVLP